MISLGFVPKYWQNTSYQQLRWNLRLVVKMQLRGLRSNALKVHLREFTEVA
jgi:hypothetical protein